MGTIIRFLESETEPPLLVMGTDTRFRPDIAAPWITDLPPFCPQKMKKYVYLRQGLINFLLLLI